ncbi:hypothetical protein DAEQUDRAFT_408343 [Daedalea quercina L-15889]|uniref:Uncharacterized protein n=1 Tax=Daedalea quercina L-15889 TaxID=1314783 RepID=A0A165NP54_9APHY|nr:hypothetical protein DAEQUDRAFT_408343 [Daedalea quercina L-15889]
MHVADSAQTKSARRISSATACENANVYGTIPCQNLQPMLSISVGPLRLLVYSIVTRRWYEANGRNSPAHTHTLSRRGSAASLTSTDDGRSSRASSSSAMSQAERPSSSFLVCCRRLTQVYTERERVKELELERQQEREHGWNKSRNASSKTLNRSASSLSLHPHERTRTLSSVMQHTPPRPDSAQSFLSPHSHTPGQPRRSLSRQSSTSSLRSSASGHSRAGSPTGSVSVEPEEEKEVEHERERNWNSPRPKWSEQPHHHGRSPSPMPASTPPASAKAVGPRERKDSTASLAQVSGRQRTQSLRSSPVPAASAHARTRTQSSIPADLKGKAPLKPWSPAHSLNVPDKSPEQPSRSPSPVHPARADGESRSHTPGHRSRFGWTFPVNRTQLPPLELDTEPDSPEKLRTAAKSRLSLKSPAAGSHLPRPASALGDAPASKRGHRRSVTELSKPTGPVPPASDGDERGDEEDGMHIEVESGSDTEPDEDAQTESPFPSFHAESQMDAVFASDEESPPATSTPTARPVPLPLSAPSSPSPSAHHRHNDTNANDGGAPSRVMRPESPPATPAHTTPASVFTLQTPPRRSPGNGSSTMSSAKLEFKTPSPPRGMPDLPDPPSFATDEGEGEGEGEDDHTPVTTSAPGNLTMMKTPRPPGAWAATPDVRHTDADATATHGAEGSSASSVLVNTPDGPAKVDVVATPGPGAPHANATATWPRTPAPPGAWLQTPGGGPASVRRRSILKVRFDVESETTASDVGEREPSAESRRRALPAEWNPDSSAEGALAMPPVAVPSGSADGKEAPETPPPRRESAVSRPFRSPGSVSVRIVDAFGREIKPEQEEQTPRAPKEARQEVPARPKTPERKAQQSKTGPTAPPTPRSRSTVRIVDAMGREVAEPGPVASGSHDGRREPEGGPADASLRSISVVEDEGSSMFSVDMPTPTNHNEALALMREKVQDMKKEAQQAEKCVPRSHIILARRLTSVGTGRAGSSRWTTGARARWRTRRAGRGVRGGRYRRSCSGWRARARARRNRGRVDMGRSGRVCGGARVGSCRPRCRRQG